MTSIDSLSRGRVVLIGAGPGDPGLLTQRGQRVLADADVVVYDRDVARLLHLARADAERIEVGAPAEGRDGAGRDRDADCGRPARAVSSRA